MPPISPCWNWWYPGKKLCPSSAIPFPPRFLFASLNPDHTPYRRLNSPVAGAHSENFFIPSGVPNSSSGDSCLPTLDFILSLWGQHLGSSKDEVVSAYGHIHIVNLCPRARIFHDNPQSGRARIWLQWAIPRLLFWGQVRVLWFVWWVSSPT